MFRKAGIVGAVACAALLTGTAAVSQSFPRLPKVPSVPKIPSLPGGVKDRSESERPVRTTGRQPVNQRSNAEFDPELYRENRTDVGKLQAGINANWSSAADNARIDQEVTEYRAVVDKLASGHFDSLPPERRASMDDLKADYDTVAQTIDREISWGEGMIQGHGVASAGYNYLLSIDTALYGAVTLFPDEPAFAEAKQKVAASMAKYGTRSGAVAAEDAAELAAARNVRMPAAVTRDAGVEALFRRAWATSGIPWKIEKIHITSGWSDKREYGRIIGQNRDAAIAARDPDNPNRCNLYDFTMFRDTGGSVRRSSHSTKRIACENIPS